MRSGDGAFDGGLCNVRGRFCSMLGSFCNLRGRYLVIYLENGGVLLGNMPCYLVAAASQIAERCLHNAKSASQIAEGIAKGTLRLFTKWVLGCGCGVDGCGGLLIG